MQLVEVKDDEQAKDFIRVNNLLHKENPAYIFPLEKDIYEVFDPKKNKTFRFGEACRWILKDEKGGLAGRIAAFVNKKYRNKGDDVPVGGIGFFDSVNDQNAADMLFDVAKHWLMQKGMQAMDGPVNFGERDRWWGLVVMGHHIPPLYCMNFNPPYYQQLFENYGFQNFFNQICYALKVKDPAPPKFFEQHEKYKNNPDVRASYVKKSELDKYARDFAIVYNKAWAGHGGLKQIDEKVVRKMFRAMKPVMDEKINWFVYNKEEPVAMWINLPDLNQWFKYLKGKFGLLEKLRFLFIKATKRNSKFVGLVYGVVPEFQGSGIDRYMIIEGARFIQQLSFDEKGTPSIGKTRYDDYEMQWIGEFNPKMINVVESLGTHKSRILTTYRYLFDRTKEFKRHPIVY